MDNGRLAYRIEHAFYDFDNGWEIVAECIIEHATGVRIVSVKYRLSAGYAQWTMQAMSKRMCDGVVGMP